MVFCLTLYEIKDVRQLTLVIFGNLAINNLKKNWLAFDVSNSREGNLGLRAQCKVL